MSESSIDTEVPNDELPAESSPADDAGAKPPESMFEAVMASVAVEPEEDPTPSPDVEKKEEGESEETETVLAVEETDDELLPFHKHPRWQEVLGKNRELTERVKIVDELESSIQQAGLDMEEVDQGVELIRLLKHEPEKALEALAPIIDQLQQFNGQGALPEDLQEAVDSGKMPEEYAKELAKARTQSQFYKNDATRVRTQVEETAAEAQERQREETSRQMKETVDKWESDWKESDPDFDKKYHRVRERVLAITMEEGFPATPTEALERAKRAKREVEKEIADLIPSKPESRTVKGGSSVNTAPEPTTMREAIEMAARGA